MAIGVVLSLLESSLLDNSHDGRVLAHYFFDVVVLPVSLGVVVAPSLDFTQVLVQRFRHLQVFLHAVDLVGVILGSPELPVGGPKVGLLVVALTPSRTRGVD